MPVEERRAALPSNEVQNTLSSDSRLEGQAVLESRVAPFPVCPGLLARGPSPPELLSL